MPDVPALAKAKRQARVHRAGSAGAGRRLRGARRSGESCRSRMSTARCASRVPARRISRRCINELGVPLLDRVSGTTDWEINLTARDDAVAWTLASSIKGATVDLPAPVGKTAAEVAPLKIERRALPGRTTGDQLTADYRGVVRAIAHRDRGGAGGASPDRVLLLLGGAAAGSRCAGPARRLRARTTSRTRPRRMACACMPGKSRAWPPAPIPRPARCADAERCRPRRRETRRLRPRAARLQGHGAARERGLEAGHAGPRSRRQRDLARTLRRRSQRPRDGAPDALRAAGSGRIASGARCRRCRRRTWPTRGRNWTSCRTRSCPRDATWASSNSSPSRWDPIGASSGWRWPMPTAASTPTAGGACAANGSRRRST